MACLIKIFILYFFIIFSFQSSALSGDMSLLASDKGRLFHSRSHQLSKDTATKPRGNLEISNNSKGSKNVRVIVRLRNNLSKEAARKIIRKDRGAFFKRLRKHTKRHRAELTDYLEEKRFKFSRGPSPSLNARSLWIANSFAITADPQEIEELRKHPDVMEVHENIILSLPPVAKESTDDPGVPVDLWNHQVIGVDAARVLGIDGTGIRIGHLDTGINADHPDFGGKLIAWAEFDADGERVESLPYESHYLGHGTHVASIMVGETTGVAPGAELISALVLPDGCGTLEQVLSGMQWVLDPDDDPDTDDGAQVVNMSWGMEGPSLVLNEAVANMIDAGVLPVCAIGNSGIGLTYSPANVPAAVGVGAVDETDSVASFSGGGIVWWDDSSVIKPDITAPGVSILGLGNDGEYQSLSGTSLAAPHVAGVAALLLQNNTELNLFQMKRFLLRTSLDLGKPGQDIRYGHGRLDISSALDFIDHYTPRLGSADLVLERRETSYGFPCLGYETYFSDGENRFLSEKVMSLFVFLGSHESTFKTLGSADVNGDRFSDLVISQTSRLDSNEYLVEYKVYLSLDSGGFSDTAETWYSYISPFPDGYEFIALADVHGDGKSDLILCEREELQTGEKLHLLVMASNGRDAFQASAQDWATIHDSYYYKVEVDVGDVNGDAKADLVFGKGYDPPFGGSYPVYYYVGISDGMTFGSFYSWLTLFSSSVTGKPEYLCMSDIDGDGADDLIFSAEAYYYPDSRSIYVCLSNGRSRFLSKQLWAGIDWGENTQLKTVADVNGDNAGDLIVTRLDTTSDHWVFEVWMSNSQSRFTKSELPWLNLDESWLIGTPKIAGAANAGLGNWSNTFN
ncbi:MAG: S8 family serine peptidase [Deltaproteobacteria bacterium]|nr:S8 family serine peptidase [Deltaproteobacteria bacterium]